MTLQHIAVIMDGNGRWAENQGLSRTKGHRAGAETAKKIVKAASDMHIPYITLYIFSTENWKRAVDEVGYLMGLIKNHLRAELSFYTENNIRVRHIGNREKLPIDMQVDIKATIEETASFNGTTVQLAINYGGKDELVRAFNRLAAQGVCDITEKNIEDVLDTAGVPPVDLLIRTGGEKRLSNFLLWQASYAELYVTDILWPDFTPHDLRHAIDEYCRRTRNFGGILCKS